MNIFMFLPIIFFFLFMVIIILVSSKSSKSSKIKPNMNISSKYKDMAYKILSTDSEVNEERIKYKAKRKFNGLLAIAGFAGFFLFTFMHNFLFLFLFIGSFIFIIISSISSKDTLLFTKVVPKIIKSYNEDLTYTHKEGIPSSTYREAKFESYDRYRSDDLVTGKILGNPFSLAEVHTENRHTDSEGRTHYTTIFHGTFTKIELNKSYDGLLNIVNNKIKLFNRDEYITIDNEAFEKIYDVFTDDKIKAMRLLTPDVTTKMIDLYNETGLYCEIKIVGKYLYMRLYTGALFAFDFSNPTKEAELVGYSIAVLDTVFKVVENFVSEMERFDV